MRTRLLLGGVVAVLLLGPAAGHAYDPRNPPSTYCGGSPGTTEVRHHADTKNAAICFAPLGNFKGAIWIDVKSRSVVFDGDSGNQSFNRCADGYAGVRADGSEPYLLFSPGANYDPTKPEGDGGSSGTGAGYGHDPFTPEERDEVISCLGIDI